MQRRSRAFRPLPWLSGEFLWNDVPAPGKAWDGREVVSTGGDADPYSLALPVNGRLSVVHFTILNL